VFQRGIVIAHCLFALLLSFAVQLESDRHA